MGDNERVVIGLTGAALLFRGLTGELGRISRGDCGRRFALHGRDGEKSPCQCTWDSFR
jgi:hypothetical protein